MLSLRERKELKMFATFMIIIISATSPMPIVSLFVSISNWAVGLVALSIWIAGMMGLAWVAGMAIAIARIFDE